MNLIGANIDQAAHYNNQNHQMAPNGITNIKRHTSVEPSALNKNNINGKNPVALIPNGMNNGRVFVRRQSSTDQAVMQQYPQ